MKKNLLVILARLEQAKQLFSSVYFNAGWTGDYMLLAHESEIPESELNWFRKKGILVKKCKPISGSEKLKTGKWPPIIFDRFYVFEPEFKKWKNIVLLEEDLIVRASIDRLTKVKGFAAVRGFSRLFKLFLDDIYVKLGKIDKKIYEELKKTYDLNAPSFNLGVIAFDTSIIKKDTFPNLVSLLNKYVEISASGDESIFNLYFYKNWEELPAVYNVDPYTLINFKKIKKEEVKGAILHFRHDKPWNPKNPFYKEWKSNLDKAELIDLKKILLAKKFEEAEIKDCQKILEKKKFSLKKNILKFKASANKTLGLLGLYLKNNRPRMYYQLNNLKEKIIR